MVIGGKPKKFKYKPAPMPLRHARMSHEGERPAPGPSVCRIPHCLDNRFTDGTGRSLLPENIIFLLLVLISVRS
jgi:hypothetical protein